MKIFLRLLIVILLILSGVALFFSIKLFGQREELKARLDRTEHYLFDISKFIEREQAENLEVRSLQTGGFEIPEIKRYYKIGPDGKPLKSPQTQMFITSGPGTMTEPLDRFKDNAEQMWRRLDETREELVKRRERVETLQRLITEKVAMIASRDEKVEQLADQLTEAREQAASLQTVIDNKDEEIAANKAVIDEQNTKMARQEDKIIQIQNDSIVLNKKVQELQHELQRLQVELGGGMAVQLTTGNQGTVLKVNPEWNFIVFSISAESKLQPGVELLVRRDTKLVAKVRVSRITLEERVAVAEIVEMWMQTPIQKGDTVDYVRQ